MQLRIEFVFLTESCPVIKINILDPRWPKKFPINHKKQMKEDDKITLIDNECVLVKHGPTAAMNAEFEKSEIYSAFSEQCKRDLLSTPTRGTCWASSAIGTPVNISQMLGTLVRIILVLNWFRLVKLELMAC